MTILQRAKSSVFGLTSDLAQINTDIGNEATTRAANDGDLATLVTTAKTDLVSAINEVNGYVGTVEGAALQATNNLSDLNDATVSRTNLNVYSTTEVDDAITTAQLNMGSNYNVDNIAGRDALTDLDLGDRVFVADDGDTKWALYKPSAVDVNGSGTAWVKLSDQDSLENSINAASIKTSYESNADTNAYTDAAKTKVDFLSVTGAIDLDDAVLKAVLEQDLATAAPVDNAPSASAVKAYADNAAAAGGSVPVLETLVVNASTTEPDTIVLSNVPKGGLNGVMNFATVRHVDVNGVAFDAPLVATADPLKFTVSVDSSTEWDGKSVQIQYLYTTV